MIAVDYRFVSKEYPAAAGLEEIRFSVEAGSFFGVLGPMQSGKTTLVRLLFDYIHPSGGEILVFGRDSVKDSAYIRRNAGYVPARVTGHSRLTVRQMLQTFRKSGKKLDEDRIRQLCEQFRMDPGTGFDALENGERKKLAILSVLLQDPPLVVLDEPSQNLDAYERELVFTELRRLHENGTTVFFTTRSVEETARYCTHAAILQNGGEYRLFKDPHGFVIGGMDGVRYKDYEIRLQPGDAIFEYTDGVTEAADDEEKLFGTERMIEALNEEPALGAEDTLLHMRDRVNDFVNGAAQSDVITMLCLRYLGPDSTDKHWKGGSAPSGRWPIFLNM